MKVFDEPLYSSWLKRNPTIYRPYRDILEKQWSDDAVAYCGSENPEPVLLLEAKIIASVKKDSSSGSTEELRIIYLKHIAKQGDSIDIARLLNSNTQEVVRNDGKHCTIEHEHVLLLRDPLAMISSWEKKSQVHDEPCSLRTIGLPTLVDIFSQLRHRSGGKRAPTVVDSTLLSKDPRGMLTTLCQRLQIPFDEKQLHWPKGPKEIDGCCLTYIHTYMLLFYYKFADVSILYFLLSDCGLRTGTSRCTAARASACPPEKPQRPRCQPR